jgi:hypothetical protein
MLFSQLFRLTFLVALLLYIGFQSLFVQTSHAVRGDHHVFEYSWVGLLLALGFNLIPLGAAWFLWRVKKDRVGVGIFLVTIPLFAVFVLPKLFMERVEVTPTHVIHRREPPHTRYDADVAFNEITSAVEIQLETGSFSTYFMSGYVFLLKDGRTLELPANTVLTAARNTIDAQLRSRGLPVAVQTVRRERQ